MLSSLRYWLPEVFDLIISSLSNIDKLTFSMAEKSLAQIRVPLTLKDKCRSSFHPDYPKHFDDSIRYHNILEAYDGQECSRNGYYKTCPLYSISPDEYISFINANITLFIQGHTMDELRLVERYRVFDLESQKIEEFSTLCECECPEVVRHFYPTMKIEKFDLSYINNESCFEAFMEMGLGYENINFEYWLNTTNFEISFLERMFPLMKPIDFSKGNLNINLDRFPLTRLKWMYSKGYTLNKKTLSFAKLDDKETLKWLIEIGQIEPKLAFKRCMIYGVKGYDWVSQKYLEEYVQIPLLKYAIEASWSYKNFKWLYWHVCFNGGNVSVDLIRSFDFYKLRNKENQRIFKFLYDRGYIIDSEQIVSWMQNISRKTAHFVFGEIGIPIVDEIAEYYFQNLSLFGGWFCSDILLKYKYELHELIPMMKIAGSQLRELISYFASLYSDEDELGYWGEKDPIKYLSFVSVSTFEECLAMCTPDDEESIYYYHYYELLFSEEC